MIAATPHDWHPKSAMEATVNYETLIRHTRPIPSGEGHEHWLESRHVEAKSEEEAYLKVKHSSDDFIACIDTFHHEGVAPFSVEVGDPLFFTDAHRPEVIVPADAEDRAG